MYLKIKLVTILYRINKIKDHLSKFLLHFNIVLKKYCIKVVENLMSNA